MTFTEFAYPALLWLLIPIALLLLWLVRKSFVRDNPRFDDAASTKRRAKLRWTVFVIRTLTIICIIIALATPLVPQSELRAGDAHITVLIDNSSSMSIMDTSFVSGFIDDLRKEVPVTVHTVAPGESSPLGDAMLTYLKPNENLLIISDGNSNEGPALSQVAAFARQRNSTINAIRLRATNDDAAVTIDAPAKSVVDTNVTIDVLISKTSDQSVHLQILLDGGEVYNQNTKDPAVRLVHSFSKGQHKISAKILDADALTQNNQYDSLLTVVDKPKILVVTQKSSGMQQLLQQLYSVTTVQSLPTDEKALAPYYAVVLIDVPASSVSASTTALTQFLYADRGNGLFVIGGPSSFDYGGYKNTVFESLLPVTVGKGKDKDSISNIAIAVDLTGSVGGGISVAPQRKIIGYDEVYNPNTKITIRKPIYEDVDLDKAAEKTYNDTGRLPLFRALAISVLEDLSNNQNVGAVAIGANATNYSQNLIGNDKLAQWDYVGGQSIGKVSLLGPKRDQLNNALEQMRGGSQASSLYWIGAPLKALEGVGGAKNIIVITDGQACENNCQASGGGSDKEGSLNLAQTVAAQGGRVYVVGVTETNSAFLQELAEAGNGIYFPATDKNKLRILFGDPSEPQGPEATGLIVLNANHFITQDINLHATMYGYNEVVPKSYSSLLVTAGGGQPALTVWNYGVGRVAALTAYNGADYGELLGKGNSLLLSRTGNWVIGDPERKELTVVTVPHMHVLEPATISVKSDKIPVNSELQFIARGGKDNYESMYTPQTTGYGTVGGIPYAATYPLEYERVGMNPQLEATLSESLGAMFDAGDVDGIVEHVQTIRQLQELRKLPWRYPFLIAAAVLFLLEIAIRRLYEVLRTRKA